MLAFEVCLTMRFTNRVTLNRRWFGCSGTLPVLALKISTEPSSRIIGYVRVGPRPHRLKVRTSPLVRGWNSAGRTPVERRIFRAHRIRNQQSAVTTKLETIGGP